VTNATWKQLKQQEISQPDVTWGRQLEHKRVEVLALRPVGWMSMAPLCGRKLCGRKLVCPHAPPGEN